MFRTLNILRSMLHAEFLVLLALQVWFAFNNNSVNVIFSLYLIASASLLYFLTILLLNRVNLRSSFSETFLILLVAIVLIFSYPLKQLWMYVDPSITVAFLRASSRTDFSDQAIAKYLVIEYIYYFAFLCGVWLTTLHKRRNNGSDFISYNLFYSKKASYLITIFLCILIPVLLFLMWQFGMYMGGEGDPLPFHLAGVIFYSHTILVPFLILCAIFLRPQKANKLLFIVLILLTFSYVAGDMAIRASRGSIITVALLFLGLVVSSRPQYSKRILYITFVSVILTIILIPLVTTIRYAQIYDNWDQSFLAERYKNISNVTISFFVMRITGAEGTGLLLSCVDFDSISTADLLSDGVISYYTNNILSVTQSGEGKTGYTPSAIGEAMLIFGPYLWPFFIPFFVSLFILINRSMRRFTPVYYPVGYSFLLAFSVAAITGGIFTRKVYILLGAFALTLLAEFVTTKKIGVKILG